MGVIRFNAKGRPKGQYKNVPLPSRKWRIRFWISLLINVALIGYICYENYDLIQPYLDKGLKTCILMINKLTNL